MSRLGEGLDALLSPAWLRRYGPLRRTKGPLLDRAALHYYTTAASVGALTGGILSLASIVLRKALHGSEMQVSVLQAIGSTSLLLGIFGGELVRGRDRRPALALFGGISRGAILLFALVQSAWAYICVAAVFFAGNALLLPAQTTLWQTSIGAQRRSSYWGWQTAITSLVSICAAIVTGLLLDFNADAFRWLYPIGGALGLLSVWMLIRMPHRGRYKRTKDTPHSPRSVFLAPLARFARLLASDGYFLHFEAAFFLYGCAFMIQAPALTLFIVDKAKMTFLGSSFAEPVLLPVGAILFSIPWGRLMQRTTPAATCALVFAILALFPALLLFSPQLVRLGVPLQWVVYLGYFIYGAGLAGMNVAWNLAPIVFAGRADASAYTGAHITLTGVRGAAVPLLGGALLRHYGEHGFAVVFSASTALFLCGSLGMLWLQRRLRRQTHV